MENFEFCFDIWDFRKLNGNLTAKVYSPLEVIIAMKYLIYVRVENI